MFVKSAVLALGLALAPAAAIAAEGASTATLSAAVTEQESVVAGSVIFRCEGTTCLAVSDASVLQAAPACATLAKKFGPVAAFTAKGKDFDAEKLEKCNAKAKKIGA